MSVLDVQDDVGFTPSATAVRTYPLCMLDATLLECPGNTVHSNTAKT